MGNTHPMWIDHIRVENFKSLVGLTYPCIASTA